MVLDLMDYFILSTRKISSADYITIYDGTEVNIYDSNTTKNIVSEEAVLKGGGAQSLSSGIFHSYHR